MKTLNKKMLWKLPPEIKIYEALGKWNYWL